MTNGRLSGLTASRKVAVGVILVVALFAFELFNFDTTRYALRYLLGDVRFWGFQWATILAVAFCAIDFAGLARLFKPEQGGEEPRMVWYLMGAWLLGATMNAIMTWWAVSLTLLSHEFGNEVLSREQLLQVVPMFVAALVWLTRILFIGALSVAGDHLFELSAGDAAEQGARTGQASARPGTEMDSPVIKIARGTGARHNEPVGRPGRVTNGSRPPMRRRPVPRPPVPGQLTRVPAGMQARGRRR